MSTNMRSLLETRQQLRQKQLQLRQLNVANWKRKASLLNTNPMEAFRQIYATSSTQTGRVVGQLVASRHFSGSTSTEFRQNVIDRIRAYNKMHGTKIRYEAICAWLNA